MAKTLDEHYGYLSDRVKLDRYQTAIEQVVQPGHSVLDLGCGTGVLGLMALRAGARKVVFIEQSAVIEVARRTVAAAGFADRAEFLQGNSFELALPEPVDLVVCDHVGYFGFDYGILGLLADARQRFLKPGGTVIPQQLDLRLAPVETVAGRQLVHQWQDGSVPDNFTWLVEAAANTRHAIQLAAPELLADAATLATLELGDGAAPYLSWQANFECTRDAALDGLAGWFDCRLCDDVEMSNSPLAGESLERPQAFLPLAAPVTVHTGDRIEATVLLRHQDQVTGWIVSLPAAGKRFTYNTFNGLLLDHDALARAQPDRAARLNQRGLARQLVLSYCDGRRTVAEVQALVQRDHPALFPSEPATLSFVAQVLSWDTSE